jgi:hypothetical protein
MSQGHGDDCPQRPLVPRAYFPQRPCLAKLGRALLRKDIEYVYLEGNDMICSSLITHLMI